MNFRKTSIYAACILLALLSFFQGCADNDDAAPRGNAVYFWRTSFRLSDAETRFLKRHDIKTIYTRFFDVVDKGGTLMPESSLLFSTPFPEGVEIVPTVFIDSKALSSPAVPSRLAGMILARVDSMMSKNGYPPSREIQIDFDWAPSNRRTYFSILSSLRDSLHAHGRRLSTTIRLHQLAQTPPPADYGALMVYNIGDFSNPEENNSIISTYNFIPYMRYLKDYRMPLITAFPAYSWDLLFRNGKFVAIARGLNLADTASFRPDGKGRYLCRRYMPLPTASSGAAPGGRIYTGDVIRHERPDFAVVDSISAMIGTTSPEALHRVAIYHLDEKSLHNFTDNEIKKIYSRD